MNQSQRIKYTVTGYNFKEISRSKGSVEYQLTDESGKERTVTAMAKLNLFKKISSVRPIYHRELPLVKMLAQTKLNESVIVDFSEFNAGNTRGSTRKSTVAIPAVRIKNQQDNHIHDLSSLLDNKPRMFQLFSFSVAGFLVFSYLVTKVS